MIHPRVVLLAAGIGGTCLMAATTRQLDLSGAALVVGAAALAAVILPFGIAATWAATRALSRGERWIAAALVGYPLSAATYLLVCRLGAEPAFLAAWLLTVAWAARLLRRRDAGEGGGTASATGSIATTAALMLIVPALLLLSTRGLAPFEAGPDGSLLYPHGIDHTIHLAFYWEMVRGFPPEQIPTAAGVPFPSYHVLAFVPGRLLSRYASLSPTAVHHALSPLLRLTLAMGAVYLAVRLRTNDRRTALAALLSAFVVAPWLEAVLAGRLVSLPSPFYFFVHSESTGGGLAVWSAVMFLLALYDRHGTAGSLVLAGVVAGLAFGFKAQMFVVFGPAVLAAFCWLACRDRRRQTLLAVFALLLAFNVAFWTSRGAGPMGALHFEPGLFARLYVYPALAADPWPWVHREVLRSLTGLPTGVGAVLVAALVVWRWAAFSPVLPAVLVNRFRGFRALGALDLALCVAFVSAVPLGAGFAATAVDRALSVFEFAQGAHPLAVCAAAINIVALRAVFDRVGLDGGRLTLASVAAVSVWAALQLAAASPYVPAREAIVLAPDEVCALRYLRDHTPPGAVTAGWRDEPVLGGTAAKRRNHQAVLAGFAGRRSVLEYYGSAIDPATDRDAALVDLFTTADRSVGESILDRYGLDYVVEFRTRPLRFESARLEPAFTRGSVRVWRVRSVRTDVGREDAPVYWGDPARFACLADSASSR